MEELEITLETEKSEEQEITLFSENISYAGGITDVQVDGVSVVTNGVANINLSSLEKTLQDILTIIQGGELDENQVAQIEQLIVSYFENKTVKEVEE
jgi:predicted ATP-grasp superfamily ATP-dependent carboligase